MRSSPTPILRIAIDGRPLLPPRTGVYRYTTGLLHGLEQCADPALQITVMKPSRPMPTSCWVLLGLQRVTAKGFDVVHFPFYYPPLAPRCPVTVAVHDALVLEHPEWFPRTWRTLMARLIRRGAHTASSIIAPSQHVARAVRHLCHVSAERTHVIPHGVDPTVWSPPSPAGLAEVRHRLALSSRWIVQLGAVEPRRGVDLLLEAVSVLRRQHCELELVLVGGVRSPIEQLRKPPPWVRLVPWLDDSFLPALLGGAAAVVAPSRGEGFDLPLLEALASGAAVVASDIPVHVEHFTGAVELFPSGDALALAAGLRRVLTDVDHGCHLRTAALAHARRFTWEECARRHLEVWQAVAAAHRGEGICHRLDAPTTRVGAGE